MGSCGRWAGWTVALVALWASGAGVGAVPDTRERKLCPPDAMEALERIFLDLGGRGWHCGAPGRVCRQPPDPFDGSHGARSEAERDMGLSWSVGLSMGWRDSRGNVKPSMTDCCKWFGVLCHLEGGGVRALLLQGNGINSTMPASLEGLPALEHLDLSHNNLHGSIPPEIGRISTLRVLLLANNSLEGVIPPSLAWPKRLERIVLTSNRLSGTIPVALGTMGELEMLLLNENQLHGTIPEELSGAKRLTHLYLHNNLLQGTVPKSLVDHEGVTHHGPKYLYVNGNDQPHRISFHHSEDPGHSVPRQRKLNNDLLNTEVQDWRDEIASETEEEHRRRRKKASKAGKRSPSPDGVCRGEQCKPERGNNKGRVGRVGVREEL